MEHYPIFPFRRTQIVIFFGYVLVLAMIIMATMIFSIGWYRQYFIHVELHESIIKECFLVIRPYFQTCFEYKNLHVWNRLKNNSLCEILTCRRSYNTLEEDHNLNVIEYIPLDDEMEPYERRIPDRIVDDVKSLQRALILFTLLIPYWLIYDQARTPIHI